MLDRSAEKLMLFSKVLIVVPTVKKGEKKRLKDNKSEKYSHNVLI
jgi:hypothetical protein